MVEEINMDGLSDDAKGVAGAWFGLMTPDSLAAVTLGLVELVPHPRTRAALNELLNWGAISWEPLNKAGGAVYRPLVDCHAALVWLMENAGRQEMKFPLMIPKPTPA